MIGLEYVMAGYLHLAAAGDITCQLKKSPEISVTASDTKLKIDNSKSKRELNNFEIDTVSPYDDSVQSHVGGLMSGELRTTSNMNLMTETYQGFGATCLMINKITVKINVNPTIYIAREYPRGSCMYNSIFEHEKKHVQVDRIIVNKYIELIGHALNEHFKKIGFKAGPVPSNFVRDAQNKLTDQSNLIVSEHTKRMNDERKKLQQNIDSLEEYNRVNNACKGS